MQKSLYQLIFVKDCSIVTNNSWVFNIVVSKTTILKYCFKIEIPKD